MLTNPYCTVREVQAECQNNRPEDIPEFETAINNASRWIDAHCRRDFLLHDHANNAFAVPHHYCAANVIYLPWPTLNLAEVVVMDPSTGVTETLAASSYHVENVALSSTSKIYRAGTWRSPDEFSTAGVLPRRMLGLPRQILLKGRFGYEPATRNDAVDTSQPAPALPADIRQACVIIAAIRSGKARREWVDGMGQRQTATKTKIPEDVIESLARYQSAII